MQKYNDNKQDVYDSLIFYSLFMIKIFLGNLIISCAKLLKQNNRAIYKNLISLFSVFVFYLLDIFIFPQNFIFFYSPKFIWNLMNLEKIDLTIDTIRKISVMITIFMFDSFIILTVPREICNVKSVSLSLKIISIVYNCLGDMQILDRIADQITKKIYPITNPIENQIYPVANPIENQIYPVANPITKRITRKLPKNIGCCDDIKVYRCKN